MISIIIVRQQNSSKNYRILLYPMGSMNWFIHKIYMNHYHSNKSVFSSPENTKRQSCMHNYHKHRVRPLQSIRNSSLITFRDELTTCILELAQVSTFKGCKTANSALIKLTFATCNTQILKYFSSKLTEIDNTNISRLGLNYFN